MIYNLKYLFSKLIKKIQVSSIKDCELDISSKLMSKGQFNNIRLGKYSYVGYGCKINNCCIGSYCSIADDVIIGGSGHPIQHVSTSPVFHEGKNVLGKVYFPHTFSPTKQTTIGHDVWIGHGAIIIAGVRIGSGSIIGAGSVVTKDVPAYEIWAGNPAKFIRHRFSGDLRAHLLELQWWTKSESWINDHAELFADPQLLVDRLKTK